MKPVPNREQLRVAAWLLMASVEHSRYLSIISLPRFVKRLPHNPRKADIQQVLWLAAALENVEKGVLVSEKSQASETEKIDNETRAAQIALKMSTKFEKMSRKSLTGMFRFADAAKKTAKQMSDIMQDQAQQIKQEFHHQLEKRKDEKDE